jgi:predicted nucleic acid-binding Zn ribbon protein
MSTEVARGRVYRCAWCGHRIMPGERFCSGACYDEFHAECAARRDD